MDSRKTAQLKSIADRLAVRSNDETAMADFQSLIRSFTSSERQDLLATLQDMILDARSAKGGAL